MDISHIFDLARIRSSFSFRIPRLSSGLADPQRKSRLIRRTAAGLLLMASLALGYAAEQTLYAEALHSLERARAPTRKIWTHALGSRTYHEVTDPSHLQKILRKLPVNVDTDGNVWMSRDSRWLVAFLNETTPEAAYCLDCTSPIPLDWETLGTNWNAFDSALTRAEKASEGLGKKPGRPGLSSYKGYHDPREIRF